MVSIPAGTLGSRAMAPSTMHESQLALRAAEVYVQHCRRDGELRTGLRSHLASLQPVELIVPAGVSGETRRALTGACEAAPRLNELAARDAWDAARTRRELAKADYWPDSAPPVLQVQ
jgi:hypothetical protein